MPKKLLIDDEEIEVEDGITLLQACELAGREIPRFCYHERLSIAGNCRMCLIQVDGMPKPVASCAMGVNDLRPTRDGTPNRIDTRTPLVKKAREGVMEFLLINHPLDCPICDQGGECDLQDQAMRYGVGGSRYDENKRAVDEKHLGPLIKTHMTRCIQCTRCVRFMTEVAGVEELGAIGRGEDMEITTYLEHGMMSELSANVVDLCPVGALNHRPWANNMRPWELRKTESIDAMDAMGAAIRVDCRGAQVMRVLPRTNDDVNEEWISDKSRHVADGLRTQRLDRPYLRRDGRLEPVDWDEALAAAAEQLSAAAPDQIGAIAGDLAGCEEVFALKELLSSLGAKNMDCRAPGETISAAHGRAGYLFNATFSAIDDADAILLIGCNPKTDAAVLNARIRRRWRVSDLEVGVIGVAEDYGYAVEAIGTDAEALETFASGGHPFLDKLKAASNPLVIVGSATSARDDGTAVLAAAAGIARTIDAAGNAADGWRTFNVLHTAASRVGGLDLGFLPDAEGRNTGEMLQGGLDVLFLMGFDDPALANTNTGFVIYLGTHGDAGAHRADLILPAAAYTEKSVTYVNMEGRPQTTARAAFPPGDAREDWTILRALSERMGKTLPFDNLQELRARMYAAAPHLAANGQVAPADMGAVALLANAGDTLSATPFVPAFEDFYFTNPIARASAVMAELSALRRTGQAKAAAE
jgi:NADH-quinone oxidoreductase subunit G